MEEFRAQLSIEEFRTQNGQDLAIISEDDRKSKDRLGGRYLHATVALTTMTEDEWTQQRPIGGELLQGNRCTDENPIIT